MSAVLNYKHLWVFWTLTAVFTATTPVHIWMNWIENHSGDRVVELLLQDQLACIYGTVKKHGAKMLNVTFLIEKENKQKYLLFKRAHLHNRAPCLERQLHQIVYPWSCHWVVTRTPRAIGNNLDSKLYSSFFKENVRYLVWTWFLDSRDTIFSDSRDTIIIFADSRDLNRVPNTP